MGVFRNIMPHVRYTNGLLKKNRRIIVFDTETTGLDDDAQIIQFSGMLLEQSDDGSMRELKRLSFYIKPDGIISDEITAITGITNDILEDAMPEEEAAPLILGFMDEGDVWAGYNVGFDILKIKYLARRQNLVFNPKEYIDILLMAKNVILKKESGIKNYKLETVTRYLYPNLDVRFHDSMEDVYASMKCMEVLSWNYRQLEENPVRCGTLKPLVNYAVYWQNPHNGSQRRIKVYIDRKDSGIYWDCANYCWSHKVDKASENRFLGCDLTYIEKQVLYKYHHNTMENLARQMAKEGNARMKKMREIAKLKEKEKQAEMTQPDGMDDIELW